MEAACPPMLEIAVKAAVDRDASNTVTMAARSKVWESSDIFGTIISYLDVPSLGMFAQVSKAFHDIAMMDKSWERNLTVLLEVIFDNAYSIEEGYENDTLTEKQQHIVPISKRLPLKSTDFLLWRKEWLADLRWVHCDTAVLYLEGHDTASEKSWLQEDVPLRMYYYEAARYGWNGIHQGIAKAILEHEKSQYSYARGNDSDEEESTTSEHIDWKGLERLPNIRLFHRPFQFSSDFRLCCSEEPDCDCGSCLESQQQCAVRKFIPWSPISTKPLVISI
jgi:hypothetical protein